MLLFIVFLYFTATSKPEKKMWNEKLKSNFETKIWNKKICCQTFFDSSADLNWKIEVKIIAELIYILLKFLLKRQLNTFFGNLIKFNQILILMIKKFLDFLKEWKFFDFKGMENPNTEVNQNSNATKQQNRISSPNGPPPPYTAAASSAPHNPPPYLNNPEPDAESPQIVTEYPVQDIQWIPPGAGYPQPGAGFAPAGMSNPPPSTIITMVETGVTSFPDQPVCMICPHCNTLIITAIEFEAGVLTWIFRVLFFLIFVLAALSCRIAYFGCCLGAFQNIAHFCPRCKRRLGVYKRCCW